MTMVIQRNYVNCKIEGDIPKKTFQRLRRTMRYPIQGYRPSFVAKYGDGFKYLITPKRRIFPAGLLYVVTKILKEEGIEYSILDLRTEPIPSDPIPLNTYKLRDYQEEMFEACLKHKLGVIRAATGSGKSAVICRLAGHYNGLKRAIYVRKLDLMRQTIKILERELNVPIGCIGGGQVDIQDLSVVMIPTAARALGEKYIKYTGHDNDDEDDPVNLNAQQKQAIKRYIESVDCFICDECHALSSASCQMISKYSKKAYYRFGFSATPYRSDGTDILINATAGPRIYDLPASTLIKRGFLVPPRVHFYRIPRDFKRHPKLPANYQPLYTEFIVEHEARNEKIVKLTHHLVKKGERPVILVQRQAHGKILQKMLSDRGLLASFIYGDTCLTDRVFALDQFESGALDVLIGSSLPYSEKILVKDRCNFVRLFDIGEFVECFTSEPGQASIQPEGYKVLTIDDQYSAEWRPITGVHKHINTYPIVEAITEGGMTSRITSNHSMIGSKFTQVQPRVEEEVLSINYVPLEEVRKDIDVVSELLTNVPSSFLSRIVVKIFGITQARVRKMKTDLLFFENPTGIKDKRTLKRVQERVQQYGEKYCDFLKWYFSNVQYRRGSRKSGDYFCSLVSVQGLSFNLLEYVKDVRIFWKRGSQKHSLPLFLPVNRDLVRLCGYFCSEGCSGDFVDKQKRGRGCIYWAADIKSLQPRKGMRDDIGKRYKQRIRQDIIECCQGVFGITPNQTKKGVKIDSYLLFVFWKFCMKCGGKAPQKRVPDIIYNVSETLRKEFLLAYFQGDGHLDIQHTPNKWETRQIIFTTSSREMVIGLLYILKSVGYKYVTVRKTEKEEYNQRPYVVKKLTTDLYSVTVRYCNFSDKILLSENQAQRGYYFKEIKNTNPVTIKSLSLQEEQEFVYDISVEGVERFVGGMGHLLHNSILQEGIDLPCITALVNAGGGKSSSAYYQKIGRAIRPNDGKTRAIVIDFIDEVKWLNKHSKERIKVLETEPLYQIKIQGK